MRCQVTGWNGFDMNFNASYTRLQEKEILGDSEIRLHCCPPGKKM